MIQEPTRKSLLHVVQRNLRAADCKTYVTRVVYFGQYDGAYEDLQKKMEDIIYELSKDDSDMLITGLFLVYPTYYMHVLEAWEDIIYKHYELMYPAGNNERSFGKAICLPSYHHVYQRFFKKWCHVYIVPPILLAVVDDHRVDDIQNHISNCLIKVYTMCEYIAETVEQEGITVQDTLYMLKGPKAAHYLPEGSVFEFLLSATSPFLKTIEDYLLIYSDMTLRAFWDENNVWPPSPGIMPRDIFDEHGHRKIFNNEN